MKMFLLSADFDSIYSKQCGTLLLKPNQDSYRKFYILSFYMFLFVGATKINEKPKFELSITVNEFEV